MGAVFRSLKSWARSSNNRRNNTTMATVTKVKIEGQYSPIQAAELQALEQQLGATLPADYREFLLAHNGGCPDPYCFPLPGHEADDCGILNQFLGIEPETDRDLLTVWQRYQQRVPANLIPIAWDPGGNLICLAMDAADRGKVYFWDHEAECNPGEMPGYDNLLLISDSFATFLNSFYDL